MSYILSCGSTADLTEEQLNQNGIHYICYTFFLDNQPYPDDLGKSISYDEFYKKIDKGSDAKTTQVNTEEYIEFFSKFLKDGKDILHIDFSSGLSGSYNNAVKAAQELSQKFPQRKILVVDSLAASGGYGLFMLKLAHLKNGGMEMDRLYHWAEELKLNVHHWFFSTDLTQYIKGGRVSKVSGWLGSVLNICPLLNVDKEGHLIPQAKIMGKKRVIKEMVAKMENFADGGKKYDQQCIIAHANAYDLAILTRDLVETTFPALKDKVILNNIGTTIGSHTGSGTVALFFWGLKRDK